MSTNTVIPKPITAVEAFEYLKAGIPFPAITKLGAIEQEGWMTPFNPRTTDSLQQDIDAGDRPFAPRTPLEQLNAYVQEHTFKGTGVYVPGPATQQIPGDPEPFTKDELDKVPNGTVVWRWRNRLYCASEVILSEPWRLTEGKLFASRSACERARERDISIDPPGRGEVDKALEILRNQDRLKARIKHIFTFHPAKPEQQAIYAEARNKAADLALFFVENSPESPELTEALKKIEEAIMHFNAGVSRNT